jgi:hypothetical protein
MPRTFLERHTERVVLGAATLASALVAAVVVGALGGEGDPLLGLPRSAPVALLLGLAVAPVVWWGLERADPWRAVPLLAVAVVAGAGLAALLGPWAGAAGGALGACAAACGVRARRHERFGVPRAASGFRPRSARRPGAGAGPPEA